MRLDRRISLLLQVYPPGWRARHGAEFCDALAASSVSGRLPQRQIRAAFAAGLRERARGDSTTPRELLKSSLHDSLIFVCGLIVAISLSMCFANGWPKFWYPGALVAIPFAVFVSSTISSRVFRGVAIAAPPSFWFIANSISARQAGYQQEEFHFMPGAVGLAVLSGLSFVGLAFAFRRRFTVAALLQLPTIATSVWGIVKVQRTGASFVGPDPQVAVRMAWAFPFLALLMVIAAVAAEVTNAPGRSGALRRLHLVAFSIGAALGVAPVPVAAAVLFVSLSLAWWNPRPALIALTWPVAYVILNITTVWLQSQRGVDFRYLLPLLAGVTFALLLRSTVVRVHRPS